MKLILYSGGYSAKNQKLDEHLMSMVPTQTPVFTYIPSQYAGSKQYYEQVKNHYMQYGVKTFNFLAIDQPFSLADIERAMESDIIYLSGGNAYYFLRHIKSSGFDRYLKNFAKRGGVILGVSAGANMLTPTIITSTIPHKMLDRNEVNVVDLKALELVDFEFAPHYKFEEAAFRRELLDYSRQTDYPVYGVPDGAGIVVNGQDTNLVGKMAKFYKGLEEIINA